MERQKRSKKEKQNKKKAKKRKGKRKKGEGKEGEGRSRAVPCEALPLAPSVELTLQLGNVRVCTSSAHPCSMAAEPPCQSPGQWEGQLACVITAGPAQRSAWPPYLRGPLLPPLLQKPPGSSPCPSSVSGRRADTLPGKGSTRGSAPCGPCLLWTDCDPLTWVICPPPPSPWKPPSQLPFILLPS